jgi:uncharacterized protein
MAFEFEHVTAAPVSPLATEHMVRMRDGARLATDVYLPEGLDGATEAVLVRLPYDKCGEYCFMPRLAPLFTAQRYAFVVQDVRGKFRSEGDDIPFVNEVLDGYDTLEWIVGQPWSNGRVGMFGDSYYGYTQWACVASGHPALRAICPRCTGADVVDLPRPVSDEVPLMLMASYLAEHWVGRDAYDFEIDWTPRPLLDVFEPIWEALGGRSHGFDLSYPHPVPLRRFPTGHPFEARPVPTLQTMGWFDNIAPWQWDDHERLARRPDWSRVEYLHIDAVDHEIYHHSDTPITEATDHDVNPAALDALLPRYVTPALEFFDVFLRESSPLDSLPKVRWRPVHGDWKSADSWPPPGAIARTLYLGPGALAEEPPEASEARRTSGRPGGRTRSTRSTTACASAAPCSASASAGSGRSGSRPTASTRWTGPASASPTGTSTWAPSAAPCAPAWACSTRPASRSSSCPAGARGSCSTACAPTASRPRTGASR